MSPAPGNPERPLAPALAESIGEHLATLSAPTRIRLLDVLRGGEASVQELADHLGLPHQNVSHHLGVLHRHGIVSRRGVGAANFFAIEDWSACWVIGRAAEAVSDRI